MNYDDEYIRLAAARAVEFLSNNTKIKEELAGNMELRTIMVTIVAVRIKTRPACIRGGLFHKRSQVLEPLAQSRNVQPAVRVRHVQCKTNREH